MKRHNFILIFLIFSIISLNLIVMYYLNTKENLIKAKFIDNSEESLGKLDNSEWEWSQPTLVSTESSEGGFYPQIVVDSIGNVHVVWYDSTNYTGAGTDNDIFYKCYNFTTGVWTTTEVLSPISTQNSLRPDLAVDIHNNVHIVWYDSTNYSSAGFDFDIFYRRLNASTGTWSTIEVVSTESTANSIFPTIHVDNADFIHVAWHDSTDYGGAGQFDTDIFYKFFNTTSNSWTTTEVISTVSFSNSVYPTITVDENYHVHLAWVDYFDYLGAGSDGDIFYQRWNSTLEAWTTTEVISQIPSGNHESDFPEIVADSFGRVHLVWHELSYLGGPGSYRNIIYRRLDVASGSWSSYTDLSASQLHNSVYPSIAVDVSGNLHVAWDDESNYGSGGSDFDIFYKFRNNTAGSWTTVTVLSSEFDGSTSNPSVGVDNSSRIHVVWDDRTNLQGAGTDRDIFHKKFAEPSGSPGNQIPGFEAPLILLTITIVYVVFWYQKRKIS